MDLNEKNFYEFLNKAILLHNNNQFKEAEQIYKLLLKTKISSSDIFRLLGTLKAQNGELEEAKSYLISSLDLKYQDYYSHLNLGTIYASIDDKKNSIKHLNECIYLDKNKFEAYDTLGRFFLNDKNYSKALPLFKKAKSIKKDIDDVDENIFKCEVYLGNWKNYRANLENISNKIKNNFIVEPFATLSLFNSRTNQKRNAELYVKKNILNKHIVKKKNFNYQNKKINIGYFSADFKEHPVAQSITGLFENHNKEKFKIFGFSLIDLEKENNHYTNRISKVIEIIDISKKKIQEIEKICTELKIDIAIDLQGFTSRFCRPEIFYLRVAPIQINYLGYSGTLGPNLCDYIIADKIIIPPEHRYDYYEKIIYLPDSFLVNDDKQIISNKKFFRAELNLPNDAIVYCAYNNIYKINPEIFEVWMNILVKVKNSVLWLYETNDDVKINLIKEAKKKNISSDRLIFSKMVKDNSEHLSRIQNADIFLDTFPYNGHTTTRDFLKAGVPVITAFGETFASRVSYSLLSALELDEDLACKSFEEYEKVAVELGQNKYHLMKIKEKLDINKEKKFLFKTSIFTKNFEKALEEAYRKYLKKIPTDHILIE